MWTQCLGLGGEKSDREGGEVVWTKGTGERHRWELGVQGLVCSQGRHLRLCLGCRGGRRGRTSRQGQPVGGEELMVLEAGADGQRWEHLLGAG